MDVAPDGEVEEEDRKSAKKKSEKTKSTASGSGTKKPQKKRGRPKKSAGNDAPRENESEQNRCKENAGYLHPHQDTKTLTSRQPRSCWLLSGRLRQQCQEEFQLIGLVHSVS